MTGEKRTRVACIECRSVKRKCDGLQPCDTCIRYSLQCSYAPKSDVAPGPPVKKTKVTPKAEVHEVSTVREGAARRSSAANSGYAFLRQLVKDIDPENPPKLQITAWNVGSRFPSGSAILNAAISITELISLDQMLALADVYYEKIDPCYSFVDREHVQQHIQHRWSVPQAARSTDAMLCGIASCASYFSKLHAVPVEPELVLLAKTILDECNDSQMQDVNVLVAWVCRVMYLRWTSEPKTAWLASCSAMHLLELAAMQTSSREDGTNGVRTPTTRISPQAQRRLFGVAQHLNTWISYDLGVSRVSLQPSLVSSDFTAPSQYTDKLLALLPTSLGLDPNEKQDDEALRSSLDTIVTKRDTQPPLIMAQANIALCILRRLSSLNNLRHSGDRLLAASLRFLSKALTAARQMVHDDTPWHHLANNPFSILCILLALDTPASLKLLPEAMQTLNEVAAAYDTQTVRDALNTAYLILSLHRKRRLEDVALLDNMLGASTGARSNSVTSAEQTEHWPLPNETEVAWLHDLMADIPSLQDVDLLGMMQPGQGFS
jgi:hypothetical protein